MDLINRIWNGVTYSWSTLLTSIGVMTQKDWLAAIGVLIGIAAAVLGELHRRRMARIQETNNTLLNELIDAIRDDTENRQDVKELIRSIRGRSDEEAHYCLLNCRDHLAGRHSVAAGAANQPGSTAEDGEVRGLP